MSTDLYGVRVLEVDPEASRLRLRVFVVYYDTTYEYHQPVPDDRSFFVRVLCDQDALGDDIAEEDRFDEDYIDRNAFRFVDRFDELERRNFPLESYEGYSDFYYERGGGWVDEEKLVQADYDVFVTKPEYLEPFSEGLTWGTTSYQTASDDLTLEDYQHIPDFNDLAASYVPFEDRPDEESVVQRISFSSDGSKLLLGNGEGGIRVIDPSDGSVILEAIDVNHWCSEPGWTHDGRVAYDSGDGFVAIDLETGERSEFTPFGATASSDGKRFLSNLFSQKLEVFDELGEVLFTAERPEEHMAYAGFDATGQRCVIAIENTRIFMADLGEDGATKNLSHDRVNSVAVSPDGRYALTSDYQSTFKVIRLDDDAIVREMNVAHQIPTAVAWSPKGDRVAISCTNEQGLLSRVSLHRTGAEIEAAAKRPLAAPKLQDKDVEDVIALYCNRTDLFDRGWRTHLDDDRTDFHLALVASGRDFDVDLVAKLDAVDAKIRTRAYEAIILFQRGESERANAALAAAEELASGVKDRQYGHTFVYAPLAAAQFLAGRTEDAETSLKLAHTKLDEEANPFQKRAVLGRALVYMGQLDEVKEIIDTEDGGWFGDFHLRLLAALVDAGEFDLLGYACQKWEIDDSWGSAEKVQRLLLGAGAYERAVDTEWLGIEPQYGVSVDVWTQWFEEDQEAASARFDAMRKEDPTDEVLVSVACMRDPSLAASNFGVMMQDYRARLLCIAALWQSEKRDLAREQLDDIDQDDRRAVIAHLYRMGGEDAVATFEGEFTDPAVNITWLGYLGRWDQVYEVISAARPTQRNPLYEAILEPARDRGEIAVMIDALAALPCSDMNSTGLRALQENIRRMLAPYVREYHP